MFDTQIISKCIIDKNVTFLGVYIYIYIVFLLYVHSYSLVHSHSDITLQYSFRVQRYRHG